MNRLESIYELFAQATLDIFKDKEMPDWLKEHKLLKDKKDIQKVFPSVGIKNFKDKINIPLQEGNLEILSENIGYSFEQIMSELESHLISELRKLKSNNPSGEDSESFADFIVLTYEARKALRAPSIYEDNGKIYLGTRSDIKKKDKLLAPQKTSVFKAYNKIAEELNKFKNNYPQITFFMPNVDAIPEVKEFHKKNIPNKDYYIVFSSSGSGAWDIATMSERGVESCQSWDGSHNACLIGSIVSKFVGIIYLTSGTDHDGKGDKMVKRCIVRFGVDKTKKKPVIIVDKMYPNENATIRTAFINALQSKTSIPVVDSNTFAETGEDKNIEIPYEKIQDKLENNEKSYNDMRLKQRQKDYSNNNSLYTKLEKIRKEIEQSLIENIKLNSYAEGSIFNDILQQLVVNSNLKDNLKSNINYTISKDIQNIDFAKKYIKLKTQKYLSSLLATNDFNSLWNLLLGHKDPEDYLKRLKKYSNDIEGLFVRFTHRIVKELQKIIDEKL